ncbi:hypothetical protein P8452_32276 [Trifolium repens]|nr:hypothetical protein P8452_32276 [Trifolium repens]
MFSTKALAGYATLLQCWIHEHFPSLDTTLEFSDSTVWANRLRNVGVTVNYSDGCFDFSSQTISKRGMNEETNRRRIPFLRRRARGICLEFTCDIDASLALLNTDALNINGSLILLP